MRLKRDPVVLLNVVAVVVMAVSDWVFPLNTEQQAVLNGVALAVANFIAAMRVHDGQLPGLMGVAKAVLALLAGFALRLNPDLQTAIMSVVSFVGMMWLRTQVAPKAAPTPAALAAPVVPVDESAGMVAVRPGVRARLA
jgi:uncharacterized membrane protein (UPF0136 family)